MYSHQSNGRVASMQYLWHEQTHDHEVLDFVVNKYQNVNLSPELELLKVQHINQLYELDNQLMELFWEHIQNDLTAHQTTVLHLTYMDYTQWEIANMLHVNQSSVVKTLTGNTDYSGGIVRKFGGVAKKLIKKMLQDPQLKDLLKQCEEIYSIHYNIRLPHFFCFRKFAGSSIQYRRWLYQ